MRTDRASAGAALSSDCCSRRLLPHLRAQPGHHCNVAPRRRPCRLGLRLLAQPRRKRNRADYGSLQYDSYFIESSQTTNDSCPRHSRVRKSPCSRYRLSMGCVFIS